MRCTERFRVALAAAIAATGRAVAIGAAASIVCGLAACGSDSHRDRASRPVPEAGSLAIGSAAATPDAGALPQRPSAIAAAPISRPAPRYLKLPPPRPVDTEAALKLQAAQRLVDAHPDSSYSGRPPEPLLAIPVLEVELHADGSIRAITVLREPRQAKDTIQLAIDAVRRAAPYGDVSRLKRPWKFVEVFLFDDERRFKPATLDR